MLNVGHVSNLELSHDLLHICQHTYIQSWNHCAHFPWNKTKQRTPRLYAEETEGMPWRLLADFPAFWYKYGSHLFFQVSKHSRTNEQSLSCSRLRQGCMDALQAKSTWIQHTTLSLSCHSHCKVKGAGSSETNSWETGQQVTDTNHRHRQEMGHAPYLLLSSRGSS